MNLWSEAGVPHKGWHCIDTDDTGYPDSECEMCGREDLRYVHTMVHDDYEFPVKVGVVCASKMEWDYTAARDRERILKNWSKRREAFASKAWKKSSSGNHWFKKDGHHFVLIASRFDPGRWALSCNGRFSRETFDSPLAARLHAFEVIDRKPLPIESSGPCSAR